MRVLVPLAGLATAFVLAACSDQSQSIVEAPEPTVALHNLPAEGWGLPLPTIDPITGDAACLDVGAITNDPTDKPFQLPDGWTQKIVTYQGDFPTVDAEVNFDMMALNETGPQRGRYLYRTHEVDENAGMSRVDLYTGNSKMVVERQDLESMDGIIWTPWGTVLLAEEVIVASFPDPAYPNIKRGLVYEYDPKDGSLTPRPAVGARSHEGFAFDEDGNLYGISESRGIANAGADGQSGALFKFVPRRRGDLSKGTLYALKVDNGMSRTGSARWVKLDLDPVTFDSDAAAQAVGATGWDRPEDIEIIRQGHDEVLYVAVTESSNLPQNNGLVLKVVLRNRTQAVVSNFVEPGVNVPAEVADPFGSDAGTGLDDPDNLETLPNGDLMIQEDDSPSDIWIARGNGAVASKVVPFARLLDCGAESTGIFYDPFRRLLYSNSQHAGLNGGRDLTVAFIPPRHW